MNYGKSFAQLFQLYRGDISLSGAVAQELPDSKNAELEQSENKFLRGLLSREGVTSFISWVVALSFIASVLFNFGFVVPWSAGGLWVFTPGDYVTMAVPIVLAFIGLPLLAMIAGGVLAPVYSLLVPIMVIFAAIRGLFRGFLKRSGPSDDQLNQKNNSDFIVIDYHSATETQRKKWVVLSWIFTVFFVLLVWLILFSSIYALGQFLLTGTSNSVLSSFRFFVFFMLLLSAVSGLSMVFTQVVELWTEKFSLNKMAVRNTKNPHVHLSRTGRAIISRYINIYKKSFLAIISLSVLGTCFISGVSAYYLVHNSLSKSGSVSLWDIDLNAKVASLIEHNAEVSDVSFSQRGDILATGSLDGAVNIWEFSSTSLVHRFEHDSRVIMLKLHPDEDRIFVGYTDGFIRVWAMSTGEIVASVKAHDASVTALSFIKNGQFLLSGSGAGQLSLWDLNTPDQKQEFAGHEGWITEINAHPDGTRFVTSSHDGSVKFWDVDSKKLISTLVEQDSGIHTMTIHPDGERFLTGSHDGVVKLWTIGQENPVRVFAGHENIVQDLKIFPDGKRFLTASWNGTVRLWGIEDSNPLRTFTGNGGVRAIAIHPDGERFVVGDLSLCVDNADERIISSNCHIRSLERGVLSFSENKRSILFKPYLSDQAVEFPGPRNIPDVWGDIDFVQDRLCPIIPFKDRILKGLKC